MAVKKQKKKTAKKTKAANKKKAATKTAGKVVVENVNHPGQKRNVDAASMAWRRPRF